MAYRTGSGPSYASENSDSVGLVKAPLCVADDGSGVRCPGCEVYSRDDTVVDGGPMFADIGTDVLWASIAILTPLFPSPDQGVFRIRS